MSIPFHSKPTETFNRISFILLLFIFFPWHATLTAQTVSFDLQPVGKGTVTTDDPLYIGCDNQRIFLIERAGRMTKRFSLVSYGFDQQELARVELGTDKETSSYGGYINGQHIDLLQAAYPSDHEMRIYRDRRNLSTLQPEGEPLVLGEYSGEKDDEFGFGIATSPNQKLLAGIFVAHRKLQGTEVKVGLYSRELEEYWTMPTNRTSFNSVTVTDEGDVLLYSLYHNGKCSFNILDGEHNENVEFTLPTDGHVIERELVRYGNGKIILALTVRGKDETFMPEGSNIDRVDVYCYDIAKKHISVEHHPFTDQEVYYLTNTKEGKSLRNHWVQFGQLAQTFSDNDGGYIMVDQAWSVSVNGTKTEWHRSGMMVIRVDVNGKILWTRTHRFCATTSWGNRQTLTHRWAATPTGVMLAWVDHEQNITCAPEKPYKLFKPSRTKGTLNVWTLTPSGKETQSYTPVGHMVLTGAAHRLDTPGKYIALLSSMRKGQLALITIEN